jgi:hypothetical protein
MSDVVSLQRRAPASRGLTRDQLRSLWLHRAVAGRVVTNPDRALRIARRNLGRLRSTHRRGQADRWLREWERLLDGPLETVLDTLTSRSPRSVELRQNSPFAGVISERERSRVLEAFGDRSAAAS